MNEELKIIIKAVADEAKKELADIKDELEKIRKQGEETGKGISCHFYAVCSINNYITL